MFSGIEQSIMAFAHQTLQMLPYGGTQIGNFAVGEIAWFIVIVECIGQAFIMKFKRVGK
jgi:hypothetical protein